MSSPVPIPIGLMTIMGEVDVNFVSIRKLPTNNWPQSEIVYQHTERMIAWRPTELHEFLRRMLGEDESDA